MYADYIESSKAQGKSEATIRTYNQQLKSFFRWLQEHDRDVRPEEITSIDAVEYRDWLQEQNKKPATINTALRVIEAFCMWLQEEGRLSHNPLAKVRKVEQVQEAPKWLDKSEKYRLIRTALKEKDKRNTAIILTLLLAGIRASELTELTPDDITIGERKGTILVRQGKGNKRRTVPMPRELRECLGDYLKERVTAEWLFDSQRGDKLTYSGLYQLVSSLGEKVKIADMSPHTLRHTYCHDLVSRGVSIEIVAQLAGHAKLETTMLYTKPGAQEMQAAVEKLNFS